MEIIISFFIGAWIIAATIISVIIYKRDCVAMADKEKR